jgi:hypothetical protein
MMNVYGRFSATLTIHTLSGRVIACRGCTRPTRVESFYAHICATSGPVLYGTEG